MKEKTLFLHTPIEHQSEDIERGVRVVVNVIESIVEELEQAGGPKVTQC